MIYGWRNAMADAFGAFSAAFPRAHTVQLTQHYRSTSLILRAASSVVLPIAGRHKASGSGGGGGGRSEACGKSGSGTGGGELWTDQPVGKPIRVVSLSDTCLAGGEAGYACARVLEFLNSGPGLRTSLSYVATTPRY